MNITVTLLAQMVAFALLIWFVNKLLWGPMSAMMAARQKRIADGLAEAERGKHELELAAKRSSEILREAKAKAIEIIAQSEKRSSEIVEEAKGQAKVEHDRIVTAANAEVEQEVFRAKEQLRVEVSAIALAGASKILGREIDAKAHNDLLEKLVAEI
ncbi:MAG: F0F1 ATP synthase subunit B [Gallionellaceae bacterium]